MASWFKSALKGVLRKEEKIYEGRMFRTYRRYRPVEGELPSWSHLFVLGGVEESYFEEFKEKLHRMIENTENITAGNIHRLGLEAVPSGKTTERSFNAVEDGRSELHQLWKSVEAVNEPRFFIEECITHGRTLEFTYKSNGEGPARVRQVKPLETFPEFFKAQHHRGFRTYRYEHIVSASFPGPALALAPSYVLQVTMDNSDFKGNGSILKLVYGMLSATGAIELNINKTPLHPEKFAVTSLR